MTAGYQKWARGYREGEPVVSRVRGHGRSLYPGSGQGAAFGLFSVGKLSPSSTRGA